MTATDLGTLIAAALPGREVVPGAVNEEGWDNLVQFAQVDGVPWVFRSPRRTEVEPELDRERRILDLVRPRLPVAVPDWQVDTRVGEHRIIGYPRLPGNPAGIDAPDGDGFTFFVPVPPPPTFVASLGAALASLHRIAPADVRAAIGAPVSDRFVVAERTETVAAALPIRDELRRWWDRILADDRFWPADLRLRHGDVHPGHVLVDPDRAVVGLIDWTDAGWGDPAHDFVDTRAAFGADVTADLVRAYGSAGGDVDHSFGDRIVTRQALFQTLAACYALDNDRPDILDLARRRFDRQAERLAAGLPPV